MVLWHDGTTSGPQGEHVSTERLSWKTLDTCTHEELLTGTQSSPFSCREQHCVSSLESATHTISDQYYMVLPQSPGSESNQLPLHIPLGCGKERPQSLRFGCDVDATMQQLGSTAQTLVTLENAASQDSSGLKGCL
eukprot:1698920-Rhodomonas_salina.1